MFDFTKMPTTTAAELVENTRRFATATLTFVPVVEVKDALAQAINLQCNLADIYGAQFDKAVAELKKNWKVAA